MLVRSKMMLIGGLIYFYCRGRRGGVHLPIRKKLQDNCMDSKNILRKVELNRFMSYRVLKHQTEYPVDYNKYYLRKTLCQYFWNLHKNKSLGIFLK